MEKAVRGLTLNGNKLNQRDASVQTGKCRRKRMCRDARLCQLTCYNDDNVLILSLPLWLLLWEPLLGSISLYCVCCALFVSWVQHWNGLITHIFHPPGVDLASEPLSTTPAVCPAHKLMIIVLCHSCKTITFYYWLICDLKTQEFAEFITISSNCMFCWQLMLLNQLWYRGRYQQTFDIFP